MPLIADQSILSALLGVGCIGTPNCIQGAAGTHTQESRKQQLCRAKEKARNQQQLMRATCQTIQGKAMTEMYQGPAEGASGVLS